MPLSLGLVVEQEKRFIFLNWPAKSSAELVQIELLFRRRGTKIVGLCVQLGVAEEFKQRAVILVRSRLSGNQHRRSRARSPLGRIVVSQDLEFVDGIHVSTNGDPT